MFPKINGREIRRENQEWTKTSKEEKTQKTKKISNGSYQKPGMKPGDREEHVLHDVVPEVVININNQINECIEIYNLYIKGI